MRLVEIRRVSTAEQAGDDRHGLARQRTGNTATAARLGATIIRTLEVSDVSRRDFISTPEWAEVRRLIADPDVHIVVDAADRFMADFGGISILAECQRTCTKVYDSTGVLDPTSFEGRILGTIKSLVAGNELDAIRHRVQGAKEAKRREGIFPSADIALPTGIRYERTKGQAKGLWRYDDDIEPVREVYRLFVEEGSRNYCEIGRSTGFSSPTVRNILSNPIYSGWWVVDEKREAGPTPTKSDGRRRDRRKVKRAPEEVIRVPVFRPKGEPPKDGDNRVDGLIDEETWHHVQEEMAAKSRAYRRTRDSKSGNRFVYRGCLWCSRCDEPIWGKTRPKKGRESGRRDMYVCKSAVHDTGKVCPTKFLHLGKVNAALDRFFTEVLATDAFGYSALQAGLDTSDIEDRERLAAAKEGLAKLQRKRGKLLELYMEDNGFSKAELDQRRHGLDEDIRREEATIHRLEQSLLIVDDKAFEEAFRDLLLTLTEFEFWTPTQKREFLQKYFPKVEVSKRGVEVVHVRLPGGFFHAGTCGGAQDLKLTIGKSWEDFQLPPETASFGIEKKPEYTSGEVAEVLGLTRDQFNRRVRNGTFEAAATTKWGKPAWTFEQVERLVAQMQAPPAKGPFGLPRKESYTSGDLCIVLGGISHERLRYLIETGAVPDCQSRDRNGHRMWTGAELLAVGLQRAAGV